MPIGRATLLATLLLCLAPVLRGQAPASADSLEPGPRPLQIDEITEYGRYTRQLIRNGNDLLAQQEELDQFSRYLGQIDAEMEAYALSSQEGFPVLSLNLLNGKIRDFRLIRDRLDGWQSSLGRQLDSTQAERALLEQAGARWRLTRDSLRFAQDSLSALATPSVPAERPAPADTTVASTDSLAASPRREATRLATLQRSVDVAESYLAELDTTQAQLEALFADQRSLNNRLDLTMQEVEEAQSELVQMQARMVRNIWVPDAPPLWKITETPSIEGGVYQSFTRASLRIVRNYLSNHPFLPYFAGFLFAFFLGLMVYFRYQARDYVETVSREADTAAVLVRYPLFSSMLLTWFATRLFFSFPEELGRIVTLVMLIPAAFLFRATDQTRSWLRVFIFVTAYLLYLALPILSFSPVLQRLLLLGIGLGATVFLIFLKLRPELLRDVDLSFWFGFFPLITWVFLILNGVGLLANIVGAMELAKLLTYATLATLIFLVVLSVILKLLRSFIYLLFLGPLFQWSYILKEDSDRVMRRIDLLLRLLGFGFWIYITLGILTVRDALWPAFLAFIRTPIKLWQFSFTLENVFAFFVVLQLSVWLSQFTRYVLAREVYPRATLGQGVSHTISLMVRFVFIILGVSLAFASAGVELDKLAIAFGALGVGIGFGLQDIVNNFMSGIILAVERPVKVGDAVEIGPNAGMVQEVGFRASQIRRWDGAEVIIPNAELVSGTVVNWTLTDRRRRLKVAVRVPFDSDMESVQRVLIDAAAEHPEVLRDPGPYLDFRGLGDAAMEIDLYFWIRNTSDIFRLGTEVRTRVYRALQEAGYTIPANIPFFPPGREPQRPDDGQGG